MRQRVLLCCEKPIIAAGFSALLRQEPDIEIIGEATGERVLGATERLSPDAILVVAPALTIIKHQRELATLAKLAKVILIAKTENVHRSIEVLRIGVSAVLSLDTSSAQLIHALRLVSTGDLLILPEDARDAFRPFPTSPQSADSASAGANLLTSREKQVVLLLARGSSNAEIAKELSVSMTTIRSHVHNVLRKLDVGTRAQAVAIAYESGLITEIETEDNARRP
ncbi:response regulator transcription factor [Actinomadura rubrisoli]|uniref:Response regulator transcription factor n=1 Tax=Actinomadura rubrisoli TaxID=2530368 RepID=A0A4R5BIA7_9ACTN|nr:response regulator transcription factor [Actinomadura rubrisoli]TDD84660.1 response regulator transcription factor [Actinomadura rubrisoli]